LARPLSRANVDELNQRARARLAAAGQLTGPTLQGPDSTAFQAGDRIVCLRNDRRLGVVNGTRATITHLDPTTRTLAATGDDGTRIELPAAYLDAGHVAHGYAITGHKAQGLTVDHTFVLGSPELYREWGYVALSRGRQTNRLYLATVDEPDDLHHHTPEPVVDQTAALTSRLQRSRAQQPVTDGLTDLAARWRHTHARLHGHDIARQQALTHRRAQLAHERQADAEQLARVRRRLEQTTAGLGRLRNRDLRFQLQADHDLRVQGLARLDNQLHQLDAELAGLPPQEEVTGLQARHHELGSQLRRAAERRADAHRHAPPAYLTTVLGAPPSEVRARRCWDQATLIIEEHRLRWGITDPARALGSQPADPIQAEEHRRASALVDQSRRELARVDRPRERQRTWRLAR
jgi:hypothetical protein